MLNIVANMLCKLNVSKMMLAFNSKHHSKCSVTEILEEILFALAVIHLNQVVFVPLWTRCIH